MKPRFSWTDRLVREALALAPDAPEEKIRFVGISTDTRAVREGDLFVALEGERFDGHDFLAEAGASGARAAVVSKDPPSDPGIPLYHVPDTLEGLGALARFRRRALPARVVGITGSSGKTSVKELLAAALSGSFRVHATHGNLNNRVGVPLSLLEAPEDAEILVIEMGTSEPGEIRTLAAIAEPDDGLVTTVAEAHLTGLGSLEGVLHEKLDLLRGTRNDGVALVGDVPDELPGTARAVRDDVHVAGFSGRADADCRAELLKQNPDGHYRIRFRGRDVGAGMAGRHGAWNLVLALSMSALIGADDVEAVNRASRVVAGRLRGESRTVGEVSLLLDCYNANPQSVRAALELLAGFPDAGLKVAILGSMLELGSRSIEIHLAVLESALELPIEILVATGEFARAARNAASRPSAPRLIAVEDVAAAYRAVRPEIIGRATVLLKGSRGVALESLVEHFEADFGPVPSGGAEEA